MVRLIHEHATLPAMRTRSIPLSDRDELVDRFCASVLARHSDRGGRAKACGRKFKILTRRGP